MSTSIPVRTGNEGPTKCLKSLERVKGIEPSYSAWKAAALPLSYTRISWITYHAKRTASTVPMHRAQASSFLVSAQKGRCSSHLRPLQGLNTSARRAYTGVSINNERR